MKLKKIASLMLAGVMAVSMLAGCNGNTKPTDPTDPIEPGTNGISAEVEKLMETEIPSYVDFKDSTDLDADLKYAVEYAGVTDVMPQYVLVDELTEITGASIGSDIRARLRTAVDATDNVWTTNIGSNDVLKAAETGASVTIPNAVAVKLYVVSSAIGENALKQMVAEAVDGYNVDEYLYSLDNDGTDNKGGNFNHEYTVSVSTCTKAVNSSIGGIGGTGVGAENPSVTFVAVQVVRTSTHQ